jgi:hypothetical protein
MALEQLSGDDWRGTATASAGGGRASELSRSVPRTGAPPVLDFCPRRRGRNLLARAGPTDLWDKEAFVTRIERRAKVAGDTRSVPRAQRRALATPLGQIAHDAVK